MTRLNLLRLNTMGAMDVAALADVSRLRSFDNRQLRDRGRLPYPMLREHGDRGFRRIEWAAAYERIAQAIRATTPRRLACYLTSRGSTNEVYYVARKVARCRGTEKVREGGRPCHSPG